MKKTCSIAVLAASFVCAPAFGTPQLWLKAGIDPTMPMGRNGDTLDSMLTAQSANASAAAAAQTTANAAIPKSGNMDDAGNLIAPVNTSIAHLKGDVANGLRISDPLHVGQETRFYYDANLSEFTIENAAAENNSVAIKNTNTCGLAANTYVGYDQQYKRISEHAAIGWGPCLPYYNTIGQDYLEISRYPYAIDGYPDDIGNEAPPAFLIQKTGLEFIPYGMNEGYGTTAKGSSSITCVDCTWAQGIKAGQIVDLPNQPGVFPINTTVVSGAGTSTLVVSNAATADLIDPAGGTWVRIGDTEYSQHDWFEDSPTGCLNFWTWGGAKFGAFYGKPFACFERNDGKVGFGGETAPSLPLDVLGGLGGNVSGKHPDRTFYGSQKAALNAQVMPGSDVTTNTLFNVFGYGTDRFVARWLTGPSRIEYQDGNTGETLWTMYVGSGSPQSRQTAHPVSTTDNGYVLSVANCGTTITLTGSTAEAVTLPSGLPTGCRITVTQLGTGTVTVVPDSSEALHWFDTAAETGTYTVAGQYASAVIEAKTAAVATVERGQ